MVDQVEGSHVGGSGNDLALLRSLRETLSKALPDADEDTDSQQKLLRTVGEMAHAAYVDRNPDKRLLAERVLHVIQAYNHFTSPLQAEPAIYWGRLLRQKLASELRFPPKMQNLWEGSENLTSDQLKAKLETAVEVHACHNHALVDALATNDDALRYYAKNWYGSCQGFSQQLTQLLQRTTGETRKSVAENLYDEFSGTSHDDLRGRFITAVDYTYDRWDAVLDPERVVDSYALMSFRTGICQLSDPFIALGAFYTVEGNWPLECKRMLTSLQQRSLTSEDVEYWQVHAFADEHHAAEWLESILDSSVTTVERQNVLLGALAQLQLRRQMYDAMLARVS